MMSVWIRMISIDFFDTLNKMFAFFETYLVNRGLALKNNVKFDNIFDLQDYF
jgi:hypothetical protein